MTQLATVDGNELRVTFGQPFGLEGHALFLKAKTLPEKACAYDWQTDTYTLTAPARFASALGLDVPMKAGSALEWAAFLLGYQKWITRMAFDAKRFAIWSDCGTGKTPMQLEWARHVMNATGGRVLIMAPLQVCHQTVEEVAKFYPGDASMTPVFLATRAELEAWCKGEGRGLALTNYHKMIDGVCNELRWLSGVVLDESSVLKSGGGVIKWNLIKSCKGIPYKLSCTATPAPNDVMEYASQASFLEKLRTENEILWTFFNRDQKTQEWKVKPHAQDAFYRFMSTWSIYLRRPSVYGFEDPFANVPEPEIVEHRLEATPEQDREAHAYMRSYDPDSLIPQDRLGVKERSKLSQIAKGFIYETAGAGAKRTTRYIPSLKPGFVTNLIRQALFENRQILVWTVFDEESRLIEEACRKAGLQGVATLHGEDDEEKRADTLDRFRHGEIRCLISKARLLGYGLNFQFCTRMVFSGFDDSFESFYQAVRRCYRYGSTEQLVVHIPYIPRLEEHMWENIIRKKKQFESDTAAQELCYVRAIEAMRKAA